MGSSQEQTNRGLPERMTIPMQGNGAMLMQNAQPARMIVVAYRIGYNTECPEQLWTLPAMYMQWMVFGATPGVRTVVTSDRYCPDAIRFWQRVTRSYVIQRVSAYRSA